MKMALWLLLLMFALHTTCTARDLKLLLVFFFCCLVQCLLAAPSSVDAASASTAAAAAAGIVDSSPSSRGIFPIIMPKIFPAKNEVYLCTMVDVEVSWLQHQI